MTSRKTGSTQFQPGRSGNPAGRPKGSGFYGEARDQLQKDWPAIRQVLVDKAKGGDIAAIRIVAERLCPPLRPIEAPIALPLPDGTLTEKAEAVLRGVADGVLPIAQASQLLAAMGALAKVHEVDEVLRRLDALEQAQEGKM